MNSSAKFFSALLKGVIIPLALFCGIYWLDKYTLGIGQISIYGFVGIPAITVMILFYYFLRKSY